MRISGRDFSDIYLFSDIDGTLGVAGVGIPMRNYEAIRRFVRRGGHFGLCTGRWVTDITRFVKGLPINVPSIINNGASLYDISAGKELFSVALPDDAISYAREIAAIDPRIKVLGVIRDGYYCLTEKTGVFEDFKLIGRRLPVKTFDEFDGPYLKFLFDCPDGGENILTAARGMGHKGVYYTRSGEAFEMIPSGISKGEGLLEFCRRFSVPREKTVFIGDNYNDREMFLTAGFSACVSETPKELAELTSLQVGECLNGAVADLIEWLEMYGSPSRASEASSLAGLRAVR